jgi:hypothetical protein
MAITFRELFSLRAKRPMIPAATIAALVAAGAPPAWAASFTVTNTADSGAGSLRQAILELNLAGAGTHSIAFNSALGTISLADDLPPILGAGQSITITGNGNTVNGGSQHALLFVGGGTVAVSNLNLANGHAIGGAGGKSETGSTGGGGLGAGGALFVNDGATVTISGVTFTGNQATGGNGGGWGSFNSQGGGGGGFGADGGWSSDVAGGGGGGVSDPGGNASGSIPGSGGGEGGSGSSMSGPGTNGQTYGGGGGGSSDPSFAAGLDGGDFGGGGGGGEDGSGGDGGFGAGGGGYNHTESSRNIGVGAVGGVAQANIDGGQATAYLERGRSFC